MQEWLMAVLFLMVMTIDGLDNVSYIPLCSSCYFNEVISSETKEKVITYKKVLKRYKKDDESR